MTAVAVFLAAAIVGGVAMRHRELYLSSSEAGTRAAIALAATAVLIVVSLAVAQPQVCTTLGGEWVPDGQACRNEGGGNGNNDPMGGSWGRATWDPRR